MKKAAVPNNEAERLRSLETLSIMDSSPEGEYDDIVKLASMLAGTPISLISLVDADRQWFKAKIGIEETETDRDIAFCAHAILEDGPTIIENTLEDQRFVDNPLVTEDPEVRFYAGFPLITSDGYALGTLCVLDKEPRALTETQVFGLQTLADQVLRNFELRRSIEESRKQNAIIAKQHENLLQSSKVQEKLLSVLGKDIKDPLVGLKSLMQLILRTELSQEEVEEIGPEAMEKIQHTQDTIDHLLYWGKVQLNSETNMTEVPLLGIFQEQLNRYIHSSQEQRVDWKMDVDPECSVQADPERLRFVVRNIVKRVLQHTQEQTVTVSSKLVQNAVELSITHTGCTAEHLKKHQAETELMIDFLETMRGAIKFENDKGFVKTTLTLVRFSEVLVN